MVREGARDQTAAEIDRVLGATNSSDAKAFVGRFKTPPRKPGGRMPPELAVANRIFVDAAMPLEPSFLDVTRKGYQAPAQLLDFRNRAGQARITINRWVAAQTHDKIKDLLPKEAVAGDTRMVLVNAIYFKAHWVTPFPQQATRPAPFLVAGDSSKPVPTMHVTAPARWGDHAGARMLDLPYYSATGPQLGMLVVVPEAQDLATVEAAYADEGFAPFMAAVNDAGTADIALPRFEIGMSFDLTPALDALGIKRAFTDAAQFDGISKVPTSISAAVHKAWAKVDETGTEAAAATAIVMQVTSEQVVHPFNVDRSFLFFIHDDKGNVLFSGRIVDPSQS